MKSFSFFILSVFWGLVMQAQNIGSDSLVDRFDSQIILTQGDRIATFGAIEAGFAFFDTSTTATFDSFFRASGNFAFNKGTLILDTDLIFSDISACHTLGNITGNNHTLSLPQKMSCIPSLTDDETNCIALQLDSLSTINNVRTIDWSFDSTYLVCGLQDNPDFIQIYKEINSSLALLDTLALPAPSNNRIRSIRWHPNKYCFAVARRNVGGGGSELFVYNFDTTTETIVTPAVSSIDVGANAWAIAWHPTKDLLAISKSRNPEIQIYSVNIDCSLNTPPIDTFNLPGGNRRPREYALDWNKTGTFLAVGVNPRGSADDFFILQFDVNAEIFNPAIDSSISFGAQVRGVEWNKVQEDKIAVGLNSTADRLRVFTHTPGSLTAFTSTGESITTNSVTWSPNGKCLAVGRSGGTDGLQTYLFDVVTPGLTLVTSVNPAGNQATLRYTPNGLRLALGSIGTPSIILYSTNAGTIIIDQTACVNFSDVRLFLNGNLKLKNCCITFNGSSVINGQGNCLTLSPTCTLIIDENSEILIKNITIKGLNNTRIHGTDHTSTFSFENTELVLDDDFTFSVSHFDIIGDVTISGEGHTFHYETDQISTVLTCGTLMLDTGVTFRYNPFNSTNNLLQFTNRTSILIMNNATLDVVDALSLSNGIIFINGCSTFNITGTPAELTLGDGIDKRNSMCIHIMPAGKLQVSSGTLIHKNI